MIITKEIQEILLNSPAKALATYADNDVNVVPVSSVKLVDGKIWLIDYFFHKTRLNIIANPNIALTFWVDLKGYQIKAKVNYVTSGKAFDNAKKWIANIHPNRIIKGLLVLDTYAIFNISIHNKRI
ncbi:MAG: pyridoxamine 5'-phosphate oxidase family protein [Flavobacteriaceae bacterium]|nr:pyridoxamine 5'-phosphate oxidase family protein [Flavobacteriaceae bacterium]